MKCKFDLACRFKLCQFKHSEILDANNRSVLDNRSDKEETNRHEITDKPKDVDPDDVNVENDDKSDNENNEDSLEYLDDIEEEDETEIIYQRFLENHKKKENEQKKKSNEENAALLMQQFKFVST